MYTARQLSFAGVTFDVKEVPVHEHYINMYDMSVELVSLCVCECMCVCMCMRAYVYIECVCMSTCMHVNSYVSEGGCVRVGVCAS